MIEPAKALWIDATAVPAAVAGNDPDAIFSLIERTAETLRALQESEQTFKAQFESERAIWRKDLEELRRTVESCLERAEAAEQEILDLKSQAKQATDLCEETSSREAAAVKLAETAEMRALLSEARYARLEAFLSKNFAEFALRRPIS